MRMVVPRGNAPRSSGYQPGALLLSYGTESESGCQGWTRTSTVRFNKPSCYFDTTWHCEELQVES